MEGDVSIDEIIAFADLVIGKPTLPLCATAGRSVEGIEHLFAAQYPHSIVDRRRAISGQSGGGAF